MSAELGWRGDTQQTPLWCWAAVLATCARHAGRPACQCEVATGILHAPCCAAAPGPCEQTASDAEVLSYLSDTLALSTSPMSAPTAAALQDAVERGDVVWLALGHDSGSHYVLVEGYDDALEMFHVLDSLMLFGGSEGPCRSSADDVMRQLRRAWIVGQPAEGWTARRIPRPLTRPASDPAVNLVQCMLAERGIAPSSDIEFLPARADWYDGRIGVPCEVLWVLSGKTRIGYALRHPSGTLFKVVLGKDPLAIIEDTLGVLPAGDQRVALTWYLSHQILARSRDVRVHAVDGPITIAFASSGLPMAGDAVIRPGWLGATVSAGALRTRLAGEPSWGGRAVTSPR